MLDATILSKLKMMVRENDVEYFEDEEFEFYYNECSKDLNMTAYRMLIVKSQNTTLHVSGLSTADSSKYFKRLAQQYRPHHSGILQGGA